MNGSWSHLLYIPITLFVDTNHHILRTALFRLHLMSSFLQHLTFHILKVQYLRHCLTNEYTARNWELFRTSALTVMIGSVKEDVNAVYKDIEQFVPHPNYNDYLNKNDIALVKLKEPIAEYTDFIRPACLPQSKTQSFDNRVCYATGFGRMNRRRPVGRFLSTDQGKYMKRRLVSAHIPCAGSRRWLSGQHAQQEVLWFTEIGRHK